METIYYFVLGLVQGLTEFLPVSSSGHLVLINKLFGNGNNFLFVSILLHIATLFSVCVVLRKEIFELISSENLQGLKKFVTEKGKILLQFQIENEKALNSLLTETS